jgi:hypothetical protein
VIQETQEPAVGQQPEGASDVFMNPSSDTGLDEVPAFMPYADDDDAVLHQAGMDKPDFMTQLLGCFMNTECPCQQEMGCAVFAEAVAEFLKDLVGEDTQTTEVPMPPQEPAQDNYSSLPYPLEHITPANTNDQPMPEVVQPADAPPANQGPGTAAAGVGAAIGDTQSNPEYPIGAENPMTGTQDSNPMTPTNTNLQEDPSYHHQYPSCPYTGQCPYTGHCPYPYHYNVPSVPYTEPVTQPVETSKPKKPAKVQPVQPTQPLKPIKEVTPMSDLETFGVDTMECRPSDLTGYQPGAGPF